MALVLHHYLEEAARHRPDHPAIVLDGRTATYAELDDRANRIAAALANAGVRRGERVAVFAPKSVETVAALYGVMKAGAAYVPIDPSSPTLRAGFIARDCDVRAVVADPEHAAAIWPELATREVRLCLLTDGGDAEQGWAETAAIAELPGPAGAELPEAVDADLAYILYTSGSTGEPKGVMLTHRNAMTFVEWAFDALGLREDDRFSSHAPFHFDLSVFDLFACAKAGGTLYPVPPDIAFMGASMAEFIGANALTVWYSVPSALMLLVTQGGVDAAGLSTLRQIVFAGEVFPTPYLRRFAALVPGAGLHNWYGPTETNVCTYHVVRDVPASDDPIPIGRACENYHCFAVTPAGLEAGVGEEGELYVRGSGVMQGYWGHPDRTAEALVPDPLGRYADRCYRTGDLVVLQDDGGFRFLGRRDHQIKTRGYRVELGEVEAAVYAHDAVREAVVVAVPDERIGHALVAFVVTHEGAELSPAALKKHVSERLPRYMVPGTVRFSDELPKTSTGKIDRQSLTKEAG
ncbi:MAG: amino acid adenylation domain-containing protein [Actinobacteria bacterium]|nr:amino acid adenylation domain-containing protein [Actinomycetota bacterium]